LTGIDVLEFYLKLEKLGIAVWIEGGWGVDALLGRQTRPHADLDILILQKDVRRLRETLEADRYREIKLEIARPYNFVMGDNQGREIDVHVVDLDDAGNALYGPPENPEVFQRSIFNGMGTIGNQRIKCIPPDWQIKWHTGYKLRECDFQDVLALCEKFGLEYPAEYAHHNKS